MNPSEVIASKCLTGHPWPQHGLCLPVPWMKSGWETLLETPLPQQVQHLKVSSWRDRQTEFSDLSQCVLVQDERFFWGDLEVGTMIGFSGVLRFKMPDGSLKDWPDVTFEVGRIPGIGPSET